jgi:hypothetical protein
MKSRDKSECIKMRDVIAVAVLLTPKFPTRSISDRTRRSKSSDSVGPTYPYWARRCRTIDIVPLNIEAAMARLKAHEGVALQGALRYVGEADRYDAVCDRPIYALNKPRSRQSLTNRQLASLLCHLDRHSPA